METTHGSARLVQGLALRACGPACVAPWTSVTTDTESETLDEQIGAVEGEGSGVQGGETTVLIADLAARIDAVGVGLAGVSVSVAFGAKAGKAGDSAGEWDPWDIERGEP